MSQIGNVISCAPQLWGAFAFANQQNDFYKNWIVLYSYQLDAGGTQQAEVVVGNGQNAVPLWASATSTVTVSPNPPGTTNPVILPCPSLVQYAAFGLPLK